MTFWFTSWWYFPKAYCPPKNSDPCFSTGSSFSINENSTFVTKVKATDKDGDALTFSLRGGADVSLFTINPTTGELSFKSAPDFERPLDAGKNNVYNVTIQVSDGKGGYDCKDLCISVKDVQEVANAAPVITTGNLHTPENQTAITTLAATDANGDAITWSISGADSALFNVDPVTGALTWKAAPNFENPLDSVNRDNIYDVTATANDGKGGVTSKSLFITVTNVNEAPSITSSASLAIDENGTAVAVLTSADPDAGASATWSIIGGDDAALFTLDPNTGALVFNAAPDAELPGDVGGDNVYSINVQVSDGLGGTATQSVTITVNDIAETNANADAFAATDRVAFAPVSVLGNDEVAAGGSLSVVAVNGGGVGGTVAGSAGGTFSIAADGTLSFATGNTDFVGLGAGETRDTSVTYTVSDGLGGTSTNTVTVTVTGVNDAPFFIDSAFDIDGGSSNPGPAGGLVNLQAGSGGPEQVTDILFVGDLDLNDTLTFSLSGDDAAFFTIDENPLDLADVAAFGIAIPDGFTDFATIRPSQFINNLTPASGGLDDFEFNFTVTVTDSSGASISTDYSFVIT